jgi:hypothetical protein
MTVTVGDLVEHPEFGPGTVIDILGANVTVDFYGEEIGCTVDELEIKKSFAPKVSDKVKAASKDKIAFRRGFEAVNLGVVPPDSSSLIEMSIGGEEISSEVHSNLENINSHGLCKVVFGNYGTGKSHYLHLVRAIALQSGWVVSYLELDPKAVDPAKPHLVYREVIAKLQFPEREDGTTTQGFHGLIKEIRKKWAEIRDLPNFRKNPWFRHGIDALQFYPHNQEQDYVSGCNWLAGQPVLITGAGSIRSLARGTNVNPRIIPNMPKVRETGEIYVFHLVVINEICQKLGYKGLLIILDEAEHVRGYNVTRRAKANNFFDLLARSAHLPFGDGSPTLNDHGYEFPKFWDNGPHFGLYVGLTEGNTFEYAYDSLKDACVFLHDQEDRVTLDSPSREEYEEWCSKLLTNFHEHYPEKTELLSAPENRQQIAETLGNLFEDNEDSDLVIRLWVKLACLVPSVILAQAADTVDDIIEIIQDAVNELTGGSMPWE